MVGPKLQRERRSVEKQAIERDDRPGKAGARIRPFSRSLPMQLMRARETVMQRFRPHLRAHGLTDQQWRIIRALVEVDHLEIVELSQRCCIHPASLSRILPRLDAESIIARRVNARDQRRVMVSITPAGRKLFETLAPQSEEIYAAIASEFGSERLSEIYRLLDELIETLGRPSERGEGVAAGDD